MKSSPSPLGAAVEAALSSRFARYRDPKKYLATFRTAAGTVFAAERTTLSEIILWLPEQDEARREAETMGLTVTRSVAWPDGPNGDYGRLATLEPIPELAVEPLLRIKVKTAGEALRVAEALA